MNTITTIEKMLASLAGYHLANNYEINAAIQAGRELLEELKGQEPVAWMQDSIELYVQDRPSEYYTIPLYTHQQPKEPLTDEMIVAGGKALAKLHAETCGLDFDDVWKYYSEDHKADAKAAIEAAHGIGKGEA